MTRYVLQDLLRVRSFRENRAARDVGAAKQAMEESRSLVERRQRESADYTAWREKREDALYQEVLGRVVRVGELEDLKSGVLTLREKELLLEQAVMEARAAERAARENLERAREAYAARVRDLRKIEEHRKAWMARELLEEERAADAEMEEVPAGHPGEDEDELSESAAPLAGVVD